MPKRGVSDCPSIYSDHVGINVTDRKPTACLQDVAHRNDRLVIFLPTPRPKPASQLTSKREFADPVRHLLFGGGVDQGRAAPDPCRSTKSRGLVRDDASGG